MNSDYVTRTRKRIDRFGDDYHYNNDDEYKKYSRRVTGRMQSMMLLFISRK